jgi:nucleoside-diphosphate-sugar epimerase
VRVLVTGASGRIGRATVHELIEHGYEVVGADRRRPSEDLPDGVKFVEAELGNVGHMVGAMSGCAAVVHLGAIPAPYGHPDEYVFANNVIGTFSVLQAAMLLGVRKVAIASSLSALGSAWSLQPKTPLYAPVDEAHPLLVEECYGLSKEVDERTAEMFHRRTGMQVAALRFCWVAPLGDVRAQAERLRDDPLHGDWWRGFWAYVDVRDAATACRLSIEADGIGFAPINVVGADTTASQPTEELIRRHCPGVELRAPIPGFWSAFSIKRAKRMLGWEPRFSWRA